MAKIIIHFKMQNSIKVLTIIRPLPEIYGDKNNNIEVLKSYTSINEVDIYTRGNDTCHSLTYLTDVWFDFRSD